MKNTILIISMFFLSFMSADGHLKSEQDVLASLEKYFEARNNNDYETIYETLHTADQLIPIKRLLECNTKEIFQ